VFEINKMYR